MFHYMYQITNLVNNKIYVGVHKTKNLDDGYMGSGKIIRSAIAKHGISNFSKVILEHFENQEAMYAREKEVVTDEFILREDVYNLRRGGHGGFDFINKNVELRIAKNKKAMRIAVESGISILANKRHYIAQEMYKDNPNRCKHCDDALDYKKKNNKFCGHSCAATVTNKSNAVTRKLLIL